MQKSDIQELYLQSSIEKSIEICRKYLRFCCIEFDKDIKD